MVWCCAYFGDVGNLFFKTAGGWLTLWSGVCEFLFPPSETSFIKALVLGRGHYQVYEILFSKLVREYELYTWPLLSILGPNSSHFQVLNGGLFLSYFVLGYCARTSATPTCFQIKSETGCGFSSALLSSFGFDSQRSHFGELTFAFLF